MTLRSNFPLGRALAGSAFALPLLCLAPSSALAGTTLVTNTKNDGVGSLRRAVQYANANPGTTIQFEIPAADPGVAGGVARIKLASELPQISANATILDGASQTAFAGNPNPNGPEVELDGVNAGFAVGIRLRAAGCAVKGLAIVRFEQTAILIQGADANGNKVQGCYLGLTAAGGAAAPNFHGVFVYDGARANMIGGALPLERNIISGNENEGVAIVGAGTEFNVVTGNYIGTNPAGTTAVPNSNGVSLGDAANNRIERNVLSGNTVTGGYVGLGAAPNIFTGNYIGTDPTGTLPVGNGAFGLGIEGDKIQIIGNVVSGNGSGSGGAGIALLGNENIVEGNFVGTDPTGTFPLANTSNGIKISGARNTIGGTQPSKRNIISANQGPGIYLSWSNAMFNQIRGNYIGTDVTGTKPLGNLEGVVAEHAFRNTIGGTTPATGNVISGNASHGVVITRNADRNQVQGNYIGTNPAGDDLGNLGAGVYIGRDPEFNGAPLNTVGGNTAAAGNRIAYNDRDGVLVARVGSTGNVIRCNSIHDNGKLGINLQTNGTAGVVTPNDNGDLDSGPNGLQNFPFLSSATVFQGNTTLTGQVRSTANTALVLDFYTSPQADASGYGEGKKWIGSLSVTTNAFGLANFTTTIKGDLRRERLSATATGNGGTSEFSGAIQVLLGGR